MQIHPLGVLCVVALSSLACSSAPSNNGFVGSGGSHAASDNASTAVGLGGSLFAGTGTAGMSDGSSGGGDVLPSSLDIVIRDFKLYDANDATTDPDFENVPQTDQNGQPSMTYLGPWDDTAIVTDTLGSDSKPVYANTNGTTLTTHGPTSFNMWYNDVAGTNIHVVYPLVLTKNADGSFGYSSEASGTVLSQADMTKMFFPIDDGTMYQTMFGNQGLPHNYSFTVELHTTFVYKGGEFFHFSGDDDVFVFINKKRVINLGGIHGPELADVTVDDLGLTKGSQYPLDFFSAERHQVGSNLLFTTTLGLMAVQPK